jgi:hypothetical protein
MRETALNIPERVSQFSPFVAYLSFADRHLSNSYKLSSFACQYPCLINHGINSTFTACAPLKKIRVSSTDLLRLALLEVVVHFSIVHL